MGKTFPFNGTPDIEFMKNVILKFDIDENEEMIRDILEFDKNDFNET